MPRRCRSDSPPDRRLPLGRRFLSPPSLCSEVLCRLREQSLLVQQLIAAFGLDFRVAYTPADHPSVTIVMALRDIALQVLILGNFHPRFIMNPPDNRSSSTFSAPTSVVLRILPKAGSSAPVGYIYDPDLSQDGGEGRLLAASAAFFTHHGHEVFRDPCPDLTAYR